MYFNAVRTVLRVFAFCAGFCSYFCADCAVVSRSAAIGCAVAVAAVSGAGALATLGETDCAPPTAQPHSGQNRTDSASSLPHSGHTRFSCHFAPHSGQNLPSNSAPHFPHFFISSFFPPFSYFFILSKYIPPPTSSSVYRRFFTFLLLFVAFRNVFRRLRAYFSFEKRLHKYSL